MITQLEEKGGGRRPEGKKGCFTNSKGEKKEDPRGLLTSIGQERKEFELFLRKRPSYPIHLSQQRRGGGRHRAT